MKTARFALISVMFFAAGCASQADTQGLADLQSGRALTAEPAAAALPATATSVSRGAQALLVPASTRVEASAAPEFREVRIPAGTTLAVVLQSSVASDTSSVEDSVRGRVRDSVRVRGITAIPAGATVSGVVTEAKRSGKVKGRARVGVRFINLRFGNETYRIRTSSYAAQAPGTKKKDAGKIAVPAAGGAVIGAIAGGKKGAAIGAGVGGGAGTGVVLATRGQEVRLPAGRVLRVRLTEPITVRVPVGR